MTQLQPCFLQLSLACRSIVMSPLLLTLPDYQLHIGQQYSSTSTLDIEPSEVDINATWIYGPALAGCVAGMPCLLLAQLYDDLGNVVVRPRQASPAGCLAASA